jgi:hypothetical protein
MVSHNVNCWLYFRGMTIDKTDLIDTNPISTRVHIRSLPIEADRLSEMEAAYSMGTVTDERKLVPGRVIRG